MHASYQQPVKVCECVHFSQRFGAPRLKKERKKERKKEKKSERQYVEGELALRRGVLAEPPSSPPSNTLPFTPFRHFSVPVFSIARGNGATKDRQV